jgi:tetratricopeptide (TPR) repeat protein
MSQDPEEQLAELHRRMDQLRRQGKHREAVELARQVCELAVQVLGDDDPNTATGFHNLGYMLWDQGDPKAARPYLQQALTIRRCVLGDDDLDIATNLDHLGLVARAMGDLPAARSHYEQALAICRRVLGTDHPNTASCSCCDKCGTIRDSSCRWYGGTWPARPMRYDRL